MIIAGMEDLKIPETILKAIELKHACKSGKTPQLLAGKSALILLEKNSTRTRVSFELGLQRLGAKVCVLDGGGSQMARGESPVDTGAVLGRYADLIVHRAKNHQTFLEVAAAAGVPSINALTDVEHPCQVLADWMTLQENWGGFANRRMAYIGDGNNMCHSYLLGAALVGMDLHVATPPGFEPNSEIVARAQAIHAGITVSNDPVVAVAGADAVATDTWVSMGHDEESDLRRSAFDGFTVDDELMSKAAPDALFLHCLPGHWGEEATWEVAHGAQSVIYDQAENRMWVQMALAAMLLSQPELELASLRNLA
jgi:ornithine carbamoyltransferase